MCIYSRHVLFLGGAFKPTFVPSWANSFIPPALNQKKTLPFFIICLSLRSSEITWNLFKTEHHSACNCSEIKLGCFSCVEGHFWRKYIFKRFLKNQDKMHFKTKSIRQEGIYCLWSLQKMYLCLWTKPHIFA